MAESTVDALDLTALDAALTGTPFAGRVQHFAEIGSTNTYAMQEGAQGAAHGSVYVADAQTGGRGRGAHTWSSPAGTGLYVSVLLRPEMTPGDALFLSLAAGLAGRAAVQSVAGFAPELRWPNDLLCGRRKLGGVLVEMQAEATRVRFVVIGIGMNVHQRAFGGELAERATSLAIEKQATQKALGAELTRGSLLVALLRALHRETEALSGAGASVGQRRLLERMERESSWVRGKRVAVGEEQAFHGVTEGLDSQGFLLVRTDAGELRTVLSGGVREAD